MKKFNFISSVILILIGALAIISFFVLTVNGEDTKKWIPALLISVVLVISGIISIIK